MSRWFLMSCLCVVMFTATAFAQTAPALIPVEPKVIADREKSLGENGPEGSKLLAYLNCGCQAESTTTETVKITWVPSLVYQFDSEAEEALPTQSTVFFAGNEVVFKITGLDRKKRYMAGLTWWDYDAGARTQSVIVGSPDSRMVRLAVPGIHLPDYEVNKQLPAEKRFILPVSFSRGGEMRLSVRREGSTNAVISELWIWEVKKKK